ncbi:DUF4303 domain-containing protein [Elizabethkingia anophelis]|uniref:DUF4303 domain-containing protein n=1 Tax=Elizabethkingia anophelis TaxID=1117645 RepID=UPI0034618CCE|nr:DUF4303 domain-containing protein [Elizabethkingia anophelis]
MNFQTLKHKIETATKKAFLEIYEKAGSEDLYAFALYSDEGAMTVCPSANSLKHLKKTPTNDITYYKFEPSEWKYEMQGADQEFNEISTLLREELDKHGNDDDWFLDFQDKLYETCVEVLEKLKQENFFTQITGKEVFLTFTISDYEINSKYIRNLISRLNDNSYKAEFYQWMKSWGTYKPIQELQNLLDSDKTITEQDVYPFTVKPSTRELTYQLLDEYNKTDLFPKEFYTIEKAAESNLVNWLVYPTELNAFPDELEYLQRISINSDEDDDAFHYEVFRYRINEPHWAAENGWMLGVVGPYYNESLPYDYPAATFSRTDSTTDKVTPEDEALWVHQNIFLQDHS